MIVFTVLSEGYADARGFVGGKRVRWADTMFAQDPELVEKLELEGKAKQVEVNEAPFCSDLVKMNRAEGIPCKIYKIQVLDSEAAELNAPYKVLQYA